TSAAATNEEGRPKPPSLRSTSARRLLAEQPLHLRRVAARELEHLGAALAGGGGDHPAVALPGLLPPHHRGRRGPVRLADAPEDEAVEGVAREAEVLRRRECRARERSVELAVVLHAVLLDGALAPDAAGAVGLLQRRPHLGHARLAGRRDLRRA